MWKNNNLSTWLTGCDNQAQIRAGINSVDWAAIADRINDAVPAMTWALQNAAKSFVNFAEQLRPLIEQAVRELADAGYRYDERAQAFVRGPDDNPIAVHRLLRYLTRAPQNRRRVREWRKNARRHRFAARKAAADYTIEHVVP